MILVTSCAIEPGADPPPPDDDLDDLATVEQGLATPNSCVDPVASHGATANDGTDDRAAFQAAINAANTASPKKQVCIPPGTFDINYQAGGSLVLSNTDNLTIAGSGHQTVLKFRTGSGGGATEWPLFVVRDGSDAVMFRDFKIDGNTSLTLTPRFFGIALGGTVSNGACTSSGAVTHVTIQNMDFTAARGYAIDICGNTSAPVQDVDISHNRFITNNAGILIEDKAERVVIAGNFFVGNPQTDITMLPSHTGAPVSPLGVTIRGNVFTRAGQATDACNAIDLAGKTAATDLAERVAVSNNLVVNGSIAVAKLGRSLVTDNVVVGAPQTACTRGIAYLRDGFDDVTLAGNTLIRPSTTVAGPVLEVARGGGAIPARLTVRADNYLQQTQATIARIESTSDVLVSGTRFRNISSPAVTNFGLVVKSTDNAVAGVTIQGCEFDGQLATGYLAAAIQLADGAHTLTQAVITGNRADGINYGVNFADTGTTGLGGTPHIASNAWSPFTGEYAFSGSAFPITTGGNSTVAWQLLAAAPTGSCTGGSVATVSTGGTGTTFYVCEGTSWVAK
jgi:hypothetical protein